MPKANHDGDIRFDDSNTSVVGVVALAMRLPEFSGAFKGALKGSLCVLGC